MGTKSIEKKMSGRDEDNFMILEQQKTIGKDIMNNNNTQQKNNNLHNNKNTNSPPEIITSTDKKLENENLSNNNNNNFNNNTNSNQKRKKNIKSRLYQVKPSFTSPIQEKKFKKRALKTAFKPKLEFEEKNCS